MLIFPSLETSSEKRTEILKNTRCPNCHQKDEIRAVVFIKYISIFFIPVLPLYKFVRLKCFHCFTKVKVKSLPIYAQEECKKLKKSVPYQLHYFLFWILLAFFLINWGIFYIIDNII